MSRTQDRPTSHRHRARSRRDGATRRRRADVHVLETGRRYMVGRRGDTYYIWRRRRRGEPIEHAWEDNARQEFVWLERQAQARRRRRWLRSLVVLGVAIAYVGAVALVLLLTRSSTSADAPAPPTPEMVSGPHVNEAGGFGFTVPEGWGVDADGTRTEVTSPAGTVTVAVDVAPDGKVDAASERAVDDLTADLAAARTEAPRPRMVAGLPAVAVGGTAIDGAVPIRFLSIVIDSGSRNHTIEVAVPRSWDAATFTADLEEILATFEPIDP